MSMFSRTKRRVVIVDDSRTIQAMLDTAFSARKDFSVVGVSGDARSAVEMVKRLMPDLVTIDLCMPYIDGASLLGMIADLQSVCKVIVSDQSAKSILMTAKLGEMGASACISKRELADDPESFFKKINAACSAVEIDRKNRLGTIDPYPRLRSIPADVPKSVAKSSTAHFGFPVPADEPLRLQAIRRKELGNATSERQFDLATSHLAQVTGFPVCLLTFIDRDTQWIKSSYGFDRTSIPRNQAFCNYTISQSSCFMVPNVASDHRFAQNPLVTGAPYVKAYVGYPITTNDGVRVGALCLIDIRPRTVSAAIVRQLTGISEILSEMIDRRPALAA